MNKQKSFRDFIGSKIELKEMPNLYMGNPNVTIGNKYLILDVDGSNFIFKDDDGHISNIGSCRFKI
jgi:hypothetical protein